VAALVIVIWWRQRRHSPSFAAGTLLAYGAFALTDYQMDLPVFAFTVGILLGLVARPRHGAEPPGNCGRQRSENLTWPGNPVALVLAALVGLLLLFLRDHWRARAAFSDGMEALHQGEVSVFNQGVNNAGRYDPASVYYRNLPACVLAEIRAYPLWFPAVDLGADRFARAVALFNESLAVDPFQELPHTHLAWLLLPSDPMAAAKHFRASAKLIPDKGGLYFGLGLALLAQNHPAAAVQALALEIVNDPAFVASPEWLNLPSFPQLRTTASRLAASRLQQIADQAGPHDPLRTARRARYTSALLRWFDGDDDALEQARALAEPNQRPLLDWLAGNDAPPCARPSLPWYALARAAAQPALAERELRSYYGIQRIPTTETTITAMARALQTHERRTLLLLPPDATNQLITLSYRERVAYPLLMRNVDAPPPRDPHLVPENRFVRDFLQPLFPEKGYLPAPLLTAEVDRIPE
jgi:hypothetical protein